MKIRIVETIEEFKKYFDLPADGNLLETDLDIVETDCDLFDRKRLDAQVLCTIAANSTGKCLDIGTSHGRSAFKLATNMKDGDVYTVNILPEQYESTAGELTTHLLTKEEIGSFYRPYGLTNIEQLYANTQTWEIPDYLNNLSFVFVDGAHDTDCVYTDTKKAYERIQDGGFILWHDFSPLFRSKHHWIDSVMKGIERFLGENNIEGEIVNLKNSWVGVLKKQVPQNRTFTETKIQGITYSLDLTEYIDNEIYTSGCFEPDTTNAISKLCKDGMTALDIGANIGAHTFRMAALVGDKGKVIAFEPMSYAFSKLKRNKGLNNFNNIILEKIALSNEFLKKEIQFDSSWPLNSTPSADAITSEVIQLMPLDSYIFLKGIGKIDFIKLDVDGYEFKIMQGAIQTLKTSKPIIVLELCEYRLNSVGDKVLDLVYFLSELGYLFFSEKDFKRFEDLDLLIQSVPKDSSINVVAIHNSGLPSKERLIQFKITDIENINRISTNLCFPEQMKKLRYLVVYPAYSQARINEEEACIIRIRSLGYDIKGFGIPCPNGWWPFQQLDRAWKERQPLLMDAYALLDHEMAQRDVLISAGGSMLHPEFIRNFSAFTVFTCADDPESSDILSRPVAPAFDFAFAYNIACVDEYKLWGCKNIEWLFHPVHPELADSTLTEDKILLDEREIDIVMFCERVYRVSGRAQRIERLLHEFPQAFVRGKGWPNGYVSAEEMVSTYRRAKIGWNLHNSLGPTNTRTTTLPAFGVMQICDNKNHLAQLFNLNEEVVGFETVEECIEKTRYYLNHDQKRREIALRGWKRAVTDYTEQKWWYKILTSIAPYCLAKLKLVINQKNVEPS